MNLQLNSQLFVFTIYINTNFLTEVKNCIVFYKNTYVIAMLCDVWRNLNPFFC